jgi:hypothetical protein
MVKPIDEIISEGLINPTMDLTIDYAQAALDEFTGNGVLSEIPIIKSVVGVVKGYLKVREIHFAKKLLTFVQQVHSGNVPAEKLQAFNERFTFDLAYRNTVVENISVVIDRYLSAEKAALYGNIFKAHIIGLLNWEDCVYLSEIIDQFSFKALPMLEKILNSGYWTKINSTNQGYTLLCNSGLMLNSGRLSEFGLIIYYYGVLKDYSRTVEVIRLENMLGPVPKSPK